MTNEKLILKVSSDQNEIEKLLQLLEHHYVVVPTSGYRKNTEDDYVHRYVTLVFKESNEKMEKVT
jgi:hypothetical protein